MGINFSILIKFDRNYLCNKLLAYHGEFKRPRISRLPFHLTWSFESTGSMCSGQAAASQDPYQALPALSAPRSKHHVCIVHVVMLEFLNLFCAGVTKQRNFTTSVILFSILVHENKLGAGLAVTFNCLCRLKFAFFRFMFPNKSDTVCLARVICFGDKRNHLPKMC